MSLAAQDKTELIQRIAQLIRDDEPEAAVEELRRFAERQAMIPGHEQWRRNRWRALSYALMEANAQLASPPRPAGPDFSPEPNPQALTTDTLQPEQGEAGQTS